MKFKQYLLNEKITDLDEMIYLIKKDCKPFLNDAKTIYKGNFFYSSRDENKSFFKKTIRQDRTPRDTPLEIQNFADDWFQKKFGVRARSQSIFCAFGSQYVEDYGEHLYYVFPIGEYKSLSSRKVGDFTLSVLDALDWKYRKYGLTVKNFKRMWDMVDDYDKKEIFKEMETMLERLNYKNKQANFQSEHMVVCKEAYLVKENITRKNVAWDYFENNLLDKPTDQEDGIIDEF